MNSQKKQCDYDAVAPYYNELMKYIPYNEWSQYLIKMFYLHNGTGDRFIDLGAGTCSLEFELAERGLDLTGIDMSMYMLNQAQRRSNTINFNMINSDIRFIPVKDNIFDCAICMYDTYNHLTDSDAGLFMNECGRILRKGGMLMFDFNTALGLKEFSEDDFIRRGQDFVSYWHMDINDDSTFCSLKLSVKCIDGSIREMSFSERAVTVEEIQHSSVQAGMNDMHFYEFLTDNPFNDMTQRGFAVCIKT